MRSLLAWYDSLGVYEAFLVRTPIALVALVLLIFHIEEQFTVEDYWSISHTVDLIWMSLALFWFLLMKRSHRNRTQSLLDGETKND